MAKNGNASALMKELLSNLFKYANPILNTVLGFNATGSRLWTLSNDSVYSSLFVNLTSRIQVHQYASGSRCERLCACELSCSVIRERAHQ